MAAEDNQADVSIDSQYTLGSHQPAIPALLSSRGSETTVTTPGATTSSSEPLQPSPVPSNVARPGRSTPELRPAGSADAQLERLVQAHERAEHYGPLRDRSDRSRERDRVGAKAERYALSPRAVSPRALTPPPGRASPRVNPVTPASSSDQVTELKSQVLELNRRLRAANRQAQEHEQAVEQQATAAVAYTQQQAAAALAQAHAEHAATMLQFREWGGGAQEEVDALLNSFHASTLRGQESEAQVAHLQSRLQHAEGIAEQAGWRHTELQQAVAQVKVAEFKAASDAQMMEAHAQLEAMAARQLKAEMQNVHTATDRLRGTLSELEERAELREADRQEIAACRLSLDQQALQLRSEFSVKEQQLMKINQDLVHGQEQIAAEKRQLAWMLQECRMPPPSAPSTPRGGLPPQVPPLPLLTASSPASGNAMMTMNDHEQRMKAAIGPLEERINQLQAMYESERQDKRKLLADVNRLNEAVDSMQSEARDTVTPLTEVRARMYGPQNRPDSGTQDVVESAAQAVIHHLALTGALGGRPRTEEVRGDASEGSGAEVNSVADSAGTGAAEETPPTAERTPTVNFATPADDTSSTRDRKWKRPSEVKVPAFPTVAQLSQWQKSVGRALVAASVHDDKAEIAWFKRASEKGVTFDDLADVGEERFKALDQLLCQGLMKKLPADLAQRIRRKEDEAWKKDTTITGLQTAWMIYDYFKTDDHLSEVYGLHDLIDLNWYGDHRMLDFLHQWDFVLDNIEGVTQTTLFQNGEKSLRDILFRQVEKSTVLSEDIAHYKRVDYSHPDRSYKFLRSAIERYIKNSHQKKLAEERRTAIRTGKNTPIEVPGAPATEGGGDTPAAPALSGGRNSAGAGAKANPKRGRSRNKDKSGSGKGGGAPTKLEDMPCYFHSAARYGVGTGCTKGKECPFSHKLFIKREDFENKERPRSSSASRGRGKGGGKGKSPSPSPTKRTTPLHCIKFLKDGTCPFEKEGKPCKYPHLNQEQYDAELAKMKAAAAAATKA